MLVLTKYFYIVFGLFTLLGGIIGFLKANSTASLVAGGISGALLITAYFLLPVSMNAGLILGLVVSVALLGQFLPKLLQKEFKPHIALSVLLGILGVILTLLSWYKE